MKILASLSVFALRQAAEMVGAKDGVDAAVRLLDERFTNHSLKLDEALRSANEKAWKGLETALAGPSLLARVSGAADDKAFYQQVGAFLDALPPADLPGTNPTGFRTKCLGELRAARSANVLDAGKLDPADLARQVAALAALGDSTRQLDAEWVRLEAIADVLHGLKFPTLAGFLRLGRGKEPSVLVTGVRYFFRRAVERDDELFRGLAFTQLERLGHRQEQGFHALEQLLEDHAGRLDGVLDDLRKVTAEARDEARGARVAAEAGLDHLDQLQGAFRQLKEEIAALRRDKGLQRPVRNGDSLSIRNDRERQRVKDFLRRLHALPREVQSSDPAVFNDLGILEHAIGEHDTARKCFGETAALSTDVRVQAEAHYNAYRTLLEQGDAKAALVEMLEAARLDSGRFAPFPLEQFQPQRILGWGGFAVAVLCRHAVTQRPRILKAIHTDGRDIDAADVIAEAQALEDLEHSAIIKLLDCNFADTARTRPYLVTEFFDGLTLAQYVKQHGPIPADEFLPLADLLAKGLHYAHSRGVTHRDVKPANLLVRKTGSTWEAKWIDFGLAVRDTAPLAGTDKPANTPGNGDIAGTIDYAAPEQMGKGDGPVGSHSDVYGFGRVCYFALLGLPLPDRDEEDELPENWRRLLSNCTARKIAKRLPTFAEVLKQLEAFPTGNREHRQREQRERQDKERERLRLQQEGERLLLDLVRQAWVRTGGEKLSAEDNRAAGQLMRQYGIAQERAQEIVREERFRWETQRPKQPTPSNIEPVQPARRLGPVLAAPPIVVPREQRTPGDIETVQLGNGVEMKFAFIPPGTFFMGSPPGELERGRAEVQHRVTLTKGYFLGVHPVTQSQWKAITGKDPSKFKGATLPVETVSWDDCVQFCEKLGKKTGKPFRLPTEAEWEYACRAGTTTPFWFGENISTNQANYDGNLTYGEGKMGVNRQKTTPVSTFSANGWNLHDMHGNVREWCNDWYGPLGESDCRDPEGNSSGSNRVLRGGSWCELPKACRAASRLWSAPDKSSSLEGCRVVLCLE